MSTLRQNINTVKKRYKERTGVDAIIKVTKQGTLNYEMFSLWCSSVDCIPDEEQNRLLYFLVTILDLYLEEDENAFQFIEAVIPLLPSLDTSIDGISWLHGYLTGVSGGDLSKLKLSLFEEEEPEHEEV